MKRISIEKARKAYKKGYAISVHAIGTDNDGRKIEIPYPIGKSDYSDKTGNFAESLKNIKKNLLIMGITAKLEFYII